MRLHSGQVHPQFVQVFRSARRRACDERAFVLTAVGIDSVVEVDAEGNYIVLVPQVAREHAGHHLWQYEQERQRRPRPDMAWTAQPRAWLGSLIYVLVLLLVPMALAQGWFRADPYDVGVMHPARIQAGEWWRAFTAVTLHWDGPHLFGNLVGGALLGFSAAQIWGNGRAWLLILLSAALANLAEAAMGIKNYVSAGASTAVFAALGLVAAHAWRTRRQRAPSALRRLAPLIAGVAVLGFFGAGAEDPEAAVSDPTNVLSHLLGFVAGALAGVLAAGARGARWLAALPQVIAGLLAAGIVLLAWALALWPSV